MTISLWPVCKRQAHEAQTLAYALSLLSAQPLNICICISVKPVIILECCEP
jgi:hypothetical protein